MLLVVVNFWRRQKVKSFFCFKVESFCSRQLKIIKEKRSLIGIIKISIVIGIVIKPVRGSESFPTLMFWKNRCNLVFLTRTTPSFTVIYFLNLPIFIVKLEESPSCTVWNNVEKSFINSTNIEYLSTFHTANSDPSRANLIFLCRKSFKDCLLP